MLEPGFQPRIVQSNHVQYVHFGFKPTAGTHSDRLLALPGALISGKSVRSKAYVHAAHTYIHTYTHTYTHMHRPTYMSYLDNYLCKLRVFHILEQT